MKSIIKTNSYNFSIILQKTKNDYIFEIVAICKIDKVKSNITNLNFIISELLEQFVSFENYENTIFVDKKTGGQVYYKAIKLFNDSKWIEMLIIELDDDRDAGEWS